ncbi:hyalin-like [Patiria miniata]|uniref:Hyalin n=1 Tax=Patiria miniata TaxID=46514 RepID=A0A913ZK27_PATMI|nr:hyalin-like [Patiria miniata]
MSWGRVPLSWALIALVLCLGFSSVESNGLTLNNCPMEITADRSNLVYWAPPTVSSTSGAYTLVGTHQSGRYYFENTTVTYTAEDDAETQTCTFDIIIQDNGSPVITSCPMDMTATAPAGATSVSASWTAPTVEDSANVNVSPDKSPGSQFDLGRNVVTYTFTFTNNGAAEMSYCSFDIFVEGGGSVSTPSLVCPDPITITLQVGQDSAPVSWDDPRYPADLGSVTTVCARSKNDQFFQGRNEINCVGYFESGVAKMCSFHVQVNANQDDQVPSIIDCPSDFTVFVAPNAMGATITWPEPTIIDDNQQDLQLVSSHTRNIFYNVGSYDVVYTGTDVSNNEVECSFQFTVENDNSAPVFTNCPAPSLTAYVQAGETSGTVSWPQLTVIDNADDNVELNGPTEENLNMTVGETRNVAYVATDNFGNTQNCQFTVTLLVDQVPEYTGCSMDTTYPTNSGVNYTNVTWPEPLVTDDLSNGRLILTKSHEPGMRRTIGVYVVEYTATDERQNVGICSFVITVADQENPVLGTCPPSQTIVLGQSQVSTDVTWTNPTAMDNSCGPQPICGTVTVTSSRNPGLFTQGDHSVTITATDMALRTDTCTFVISVMPYIPDTTQPVWSVCPSSISENTDSGQPTYQYTWVEPTATDDRGVVFRFASHSPGFNFPIGTTTVTYRARDAEGNEGVCTFDVIVADNEAPVWTPNTGCGSTITHYVRTSGSLTLPVPTPAATDNSGVPPTITNTLTTRETFTFTTDIGSYQFQYTATDGSSNPVSNCMVTVTLIADANPWTLRGSVTLTRIRGQAGQFSNAAAPQRLTELMEDMDRLFRGSDVRSHFVGAESISHIFTGGNPRVTFRLYFNRLREGRHTSRQIADAFYKAIGSTLSFATNNFVLSGSLDFHVREFKMTSTIVRMGSTVNPPFVGQYNDDRSSLYIGLENNINQGMDSTYSGFFGYQVSVLIDLRDGSIINDVVLVFDDGSQTTEAAIVNQFNNALDTSGQLPGTGLYFNAILTVENQEICPANECQNGGTCTYNAAYTNMCTCAENYSGTNCETVPTTLNLSPLAIAAIVGGAILLLLLILALFCCCMYFCREPLGPYKDHRYMERPFQIVDDEESVVSSVDVFMMPRERPYRDSMPLALPPPAPVLALEPPPPPEAPILRLDDDYYPMEEEMYGRHNNAFAMDMYRSPDMDTYPSDAPSFSPDGEVYVTGPNQVAIRPSTKRSHYYRY